MNVTILIRPEEMNTANIAVQHIFNSHAGIVHQEHESIDLYYHNISNYDDNDMRSLINLDLTVTQPRIICLSSDIDLELANFGLTWDSLNQHLQSFGYQVSYQSYNLLNLGIPLNNTKCFIIAFKYDFDLGNFSYPEYQYPIQFNQMQFSDVEPEQYFNKAQAQQRAFYLNANVANKQMYHKTVFKQAHSLMNNKKKHQAFYFYVEQDGLVRDLTIDEIKQILQLPQDIEVNQDNVLSYQNTVPFPLLKNIFLNIKFVLQNNYFEQDLLFA